MVKGLVIEIFEYYSGTVVLLQGYIKTEIKHLCRFKNKPMLLLFYLRTLLLKITANRSDAKKSLKELAY